MRMNRGWRFAMASGLAAMLADAGPTALAAEPPTVVLVIDGSGSMWGKIEGERLAKLYMTRDALKAGLSRIPAETRVGLVMFGHRRTGDCSDVETVVKPEALSSERLTTPIDKMNARGRGPIASALKEAAKDLGAPAAASTVILVHDDNDNCQGDPCAAVADLRQAHPKTTVHLISLGMRREDAQRMACLPKATGGRHFEVGSQPQMIEAIDEALKLAAADFKPAVAAPAPAPAAPPAPQKQPGLRLTALLAPGGEPVDLAVRWRITKAGEPAAVVWEGEAAAPVLDLPGGRYDIEAGLGFVTARAAVEVVQGEVQALALPFNAGIVKLGSMPGQSQSLMRDALVTFRRIEGATTETVAMQRGPAPEIAIAAGTYIVSITVGAVRLERGLIIRPGDRAPFQPSLNFGEVELTALASTGGIALDDAEISLFEDDPDAPQGRREVARSVASNPKFALPPGTYYVVARLGTAEARERITVRAGDIDRRALVLDLAQLTVAVRLPGLRLDGSESVSHRLERIGGETRDVLYVNRVSGTVQVAAGKYKIETRLGIGNVLSEREIELKPGAREQISIEPPAGGLVLRLLDQPGGTAVADVAWDIRDAQGRTIWIGNQTEARPLLLAGRYTIVAGTRGRQIERPVEVRQGELRTVDLTPQ